ncbi:hypothetical protein PG987_015413 [Apiospora arundinis]
MAMNRDKTLLPETADEILNACLVSSPSANSLFNDAYLAQYNLLTDTIRVTGAVIYMKAEYISSNMLSILEVLAISCISMAVQGFFCAGNNGQMAPTVLTKEHDDRNKKNSSDDGGEYHALAGLITFLTGPYQASAAEANNLMTIALS